MFVLAYLFVPPFRSLLDQIRPSAYLAAVLMLGFLSNLNIGDNTYKKGKISVNGRVLQTTHEHSRSAPGTSVAMKRIWMRTDNIAMQLVRDRRMSRTTRFFPRREMGETAAPAHGGYPNVDDAGEHLFVPLVDRLPGPCLQRLSRNETGCHLPLASAEARIRRW